MLDVRAKARRLLQQNPQGLGLIVIDYLQLCGGRYNEEPRTSVGRVSYVARALARDMGAHTVQESGAPELNNALMRATQVVAGWRGGAVLILPADLPLITPEDLAGMAAIGQDLQSIVIATDQNEDGTNAMLVRPPGLIQYAYGTGSFQRHMELAREAGAKVKRYYSERLALDIDMPADLDAYYRLSGSSQEALTP